MTSSTISCSRRPSRLIADPILLISNSVMFLKISAEISSPNESNSMAAFWAPEYLLVAMGRSPPAQGVRNFDGSSPDFDDLLPQRILFWRFFTYFKQSLRAAKDGQHFDAGLSTLLTPVTFVARIFRPKGYRSRLVTALAPGYGTCSKGGAASSPEATETLFPGCCSRCS